MDVPINAKVNCSDGPCGKSTRIIIKPISKEITHLVVSEDSMFNGSEHVVPMDRIMESSTEKIQLKCSRDELKEMPLFTSTEFLPSDLGHYTGASYLMWPYFPAVTPLVSSREEHIPTDEMIIRRGAGVEAIDGTVGKVDEFLIDPTHDRISHMILQEGHLWGKRDITIPISQIDHFEVNTVYLRLSREDIDKLPSIPVNRS